MDELWRQFNKEIWKAKKIAKFRFVKAGGTETHGTISTRQGQIIPEEATQISEQGPMDDDDAAFGNFTSMDADERYNWGEYVMANYRRRRSGSVSSLDEAFGMAE